MSDYPKRLLIGVPGASMYDQVDPGHGILLQSLQSAGLVERADLYLSEGPHDIARNRICEHAVKAGYDGILMIDRDITPPVPGMFEILRSSFDIVCPLMWTWKGEPMALVMGEVQGGWKVLPQPWKSWQEVDATGTGCMFIRTKIIEKIERPLFRFKVLNQEGTDFEGEDFDFCRKAKRAGAKIGVCTKFQAGHKITVDILDVLKWHMDRVNGK